jgi:enoyl-CoA hydratase/carnithine racemase
MIWSVLEETAQMQAAASVGHKPIILYQQSGGVAVVTLNRPDARNSLSAALLAALDTTLGDIASDSSVRAVVIAASGPAFCAGHDLKELTARRGDDDGGRAFYEHVMARCSTVMQAIVHLPQPVIACVHGTATAAGCQMVASCDLAVAADSATFCTPGVDIGLFCTTPMVALSRNIAPKHAMEMLLTGDPISAARAHQIGLVNRVVAAGTEHAAAIELAQQIAAKSAMTVRLGKRAFHSQIDLGLADAYRLAARIMVDNLLTHDAAEGTAAFLDKRDPRWADR